MLTATCKECGKSITYCQGDSGIWFTENTTHQCWGHQAHKPDPDTIAQVIEMDLDDGPFNEDDFVPEGVEDDPLGLDSR